MIKKNLGHQVISGIVKRYRSSMWKKTTTSISDNLGKKGKQFSSDKVEMGTC